MSVNAIIQLPMNIRVRDVARVIGKLVGFPSQKRILAGAGPNKKTYWAVDVDWIKVEGCKWSPGTATISWSGAPGIKASGSVDYDYETNGRYHLLKPPSEPRWILIGLRLLEFFGGKMYFNDCDDNVNPHIVKRKPNRINCPEDGKAWQNLQDRIHALEPLTTDDVTRCVDMKLAYYPLSE